MQRLEQALHFAVSHFTPFARLDPGDGQWADAKSPQPFDGDSDRIHHFPDEVIDAFVHDDLEDQPLGRLPSDADLLRYDPLTLDHDPIAQSLKRGVRRPAQCEDLILLVQVVAGMHHAIGDVTIVGQEQKALGVPVEPADRINPFRDLHKVHDRAAVALVFDGGDITARFIEQKVARALWLQNFAIDSDHGADWIRFRAHFGDDRAIDLHPAGADHLLGISSRSNAPGGQNAL